MQAVYEFDQRWFEAIHLGWQHPWLTPIFTVFAYLGLSHVQLAFALPLLFRKPTRRYFWALGVSVFISGLPVAQGFKELLYRERPSNLALASPQEPHRFDSFPSGHTSTSFAMAFLIVMITRKTRHAWMGPVALFLALMIGLSRIYRGVHWPTDVIAGIGAGALSAALTWLIWALAGHPLTLEPTEPSPSGSTPRPSTAP